VKRIEYFRIFSPKICLILFSWGGKFGFLRGLHQVGILLGNDVMAGEIAVLGLLSNSAWAKICPSYKIRLVCNCKNSFD
jgi:hypothetical protein